jgi:hypothetical protein
VISREQLATLKARNPVTAIASRYVRLRPYRGGGLIGSCPICSPDRHKKAATRFECDVDRWVCAVCQDGGDVIKLVERVEGLSFLDAVEWLGGVHATETYGAGACGPRRAMGRIAGEAELLLEREKECDALLAVWLRCLPAAGTPVEEYLRLRKLQLPPGGGLRAAPDMPLYATGLKPVHRGWAMVAAIVGREGQFTGLHITWIDLDEPGGKVRVVDPETNELLPARKVRGRKEGGVIDVAWNIQPRSLIIGEGYETVASVWLALERAGRDLSRTALWSAVDLGNMAGRARESVPHPTLKAADNRPRRVPGPEPELAHPGIGIPESVVEVVLLGDGDSDRFTTECAIARAGKRFMRRGRSVKVAWAPRGHDFNDLLRRSSSLSDRIVSIIDNATPTATSSVISKASMSDARSRAGCG